MDTPIICRRRERSPYTSEALSLQLSHVKNQYHFEEVVLADEEGNVLANAGSRTRALMIAAVAPEHDPAKRRETIAGGLTVNLDAPESMLDVTPFDAEGQRAYLCVLAAPQRRARKGSDHAMRGIRRILTNTRVRGAEARKIKI